jgi:hypothetical protein
MNPCHVYPMPTPSKAQAPIGPPHTVHKGVKRMPCMPKTEHNVKQIPVIQGIGPPSLLQSQRASPYSLTPDFFKAIPIGHKWTDAERRLFLKSPLELRAMLEQKEEEVRRLTFKADYYTNKSHDLGIQLAAAMGALESQTQQNSEDQLYLSRTLDIIREENARLAVMVSHYVKRERDYRSMAEQVDYYARKEKEDREMRTIASLIWREPCDPPAYINNFPLEPEATPADDFFTTDNSFITGEEAPPIIWADPAAELLEASRHIWADPTAKLLEASRHIWVDAGEKRKTRTEQENPRGYGKPKVSWTSPEMLDSKH